MKRLFFVLFFFIALAACNESEEIIERTPVINLDDEDGIYQVKAGKELLIAPSYQFVENASFTWTVDGEVVGRDSSFLFCQKETGEVVLDLEVSREEGNVSVREELKIEVLPLELPLITLPGHEEGYVVLPGQELRLEPIVQDSLALTFSWTVDGVKVSEEKDYVFNASETGAHRLVFMTENEDGRDTVSFEVKVCTLDEMPLKWTFDQKEYYLSSGRSIRLVPLDIVAPGEVSYRWKIGGRMVQESDKPAYVFAEKKEGEYEVEVTMSRGPFRLDEKLKVTVCPAEGKYRRARTAVSKADFSKVHCFLPAPGQFVNNYRKNPEDGAFLVLHTMKEACSYAEKVLRNDGFVSLGGFGGQIVIGFDHSIDNTGGYDFAVEGNPFDGSSEPGIVWVMQDENGDGKPNDTWYELKGSETGKTGTIQDYAVTYYRPAGPGMDVQWTDNRGGKGCIQYLKEFHPQDYYYPAWMKENKYVLRGTCLKSKSYDQSGNGTDWVNPSFDWGYADNFSTVDRVLAGTDSSSKTNYFKISNAIDHSGKAAGLKYIDFVKVQTGLNVQCGWIGEVSTEVFGFFDCSMRKK